MIVGIGEYYRSGTHSWHVGPGVTATISFESPPDDIELFFRETQGGVPSHVSVVLTGEAKFTFPGSETFQLVGIGGGNIVLIEVVNESSVADVVVDDFSFVPKSSPQLLQLTGIAGVALLARWRSRSKRRDTHRASAIPTP